MGVQRAFRRAKVENTIVVANDGLIALEKLRGDVRKPYLVLLDLNMPRMNGIEFLAEARKDDLLRDSLIFVLTTSKDETTSARPMATISRAISSTSRTAASSTPPK